MSNAFRIAAAAAIFSLTSLSLAQQAGSPPAAASAPAAPVSAPAKHAPPSLAKDAAPGGGPDKVWVNLNSSTYHCPGDRYYGKTANGRYMTEAAAKSAGGHGAGGKTCFAK